MESESILYFAYWFFSKKQAGDRVSILQSICLEGKYPELLILPLGLFMH